MNRLISLLLALTVSAFAAGVNTNAPTVVLKWNWAPRPQDLGGMSTNDYLTNLTFAIYSTPNCTVALTNWPMLTNVAALVAQVGTTNFELAIPIDGQTRFYVGKAKARTQGESDFSGVAVWVPAPPPVQGLGIKVADAVIDPTK